MLSRESTVYGVSGLVAAVTLFGAGYWFRGYKDSKVPIVTEPPTSD